MTRHFLGLALLLCSLASGAAIVRGNHVSIACASDPCTATSAAISTTGASLLVCNVSVYNNNTVPTPSDNQSNTWNGTTARNTVNTTGHEEIFYAYSKAGGALATAASHTFSVSGSFVSMNCAAYSGTATTTPLDQQNGTALTASPYTVGSITPSAAGALIVSGSGGNVTTFAIDSSMTVFESVDAFGTSVGCGSSCVGSGLADVIQVGAASINPTWTFQATTVNAGLNVASFTAAGGGGGSKTCTLTLLGAGPC